MADIEIRIDNGLNTSGDPLTLGEGFLRVCEGWIYMPDDPTRLHKHPGRVQAAELPPATTTNGFVFLQYEGTDPLFLVGGSSAFFTVDAATSGILSADWAHVQNQVPANYSRAGEFLKAIPDGDNGWIFWCGDTSRPLIREEGGITWFLGLKKPISGTLTSIIIPPTIVRPTSSTQILTAISLNGVTVTPTEVWSTPALARDTDLDTSMKGDYKFKLPKKYAAENFSFTEAGTVASGMNLILTYGGSIKSGGTGKIHFQVSYDNGANYTTIHTFTMDSSNPAHAAGTTTSPFKESVQALLTSGGSWTNLEVRVVAEIDSFNVFQPAVFDIRAQSADTGSTDNVEAGTFYYVHTEVFEIGGTRPRYIESAPSQPVAIVLDGTEKGVVYTFDTTSPKANLPSDGVANNPTLELKHYRKIYRSTKTGIWPDLGYVGTALIDALTWTDVFDTPSDILGSPGINVVYEKDVPVEAAGTPPPFRDAVYFRGFIIAIPEDDPFKIIWSLPGQPHYYPSPAQELSLVPTNRNDELKGITAMGDTIIVFARTMAHRIRQLQTVDQPNYNAQGIEIDPISPNEGLAGNALSHCLSYSQKGHIVAVWVSDNGIWMTDGSLVAEGGMGIVKLSVFMDWRREVDVSGLSTSRLTYDSTLQILIFDYDDPDGNRQTRYFHSAPHHWVASGQDQAVPKTTGPHTQFPALQRATGEVDGLIRLFSLDSDAELIYNERDGTDLSGVPIVSHLETGKPYVAGMNSEFQIFDGALGHSDWGPSESCELVILTENTRDGITQTRHQKGTRLNGVRTTKLDTVNHSGQAVIFQISHEGKTVSDGSSLRAIGPLVWDIDSLGDVEG